MYEVLVVENMPHQGISVYQTIDAFRAAFFDRRRARLRYVHCPVAGLSHARNAGIAEARGEILCFLDDDAEAAPDWLEQIAHAFAAHPDAGIIGGHIILQPPEPRPRVLKEGLESFWSQFITGCSDYTEVDGWAEFPWGANWCARRKVLLEIGGFRSSYGRRGSNYWGGEELVAAAQARELGYKVAVLPQARVLHRVAASRFSWKHLWRTILAARLVAYQAERDLYLRPGSQPATRRAGPPDSPGPSAYPQVALLQLAARLVEMTVRLRDRVVDLADRMRRLR